MSKPRTLTDVIRGRVDRIDPLLTACEADCPEDLQDELDRLLTEADRLAATLQHVLAQARDTLSGDRVRLGDYTQRLPGGKSARWPRFGRKRD